MLKNVLRFIKGIKIDTPLFLGLLVLIGVGMLNLYSSSGQDISMFLGQLRNVAFALTFMLILAQLPPDFYCRWSLPAYAGCVLLLILVWKFGTVNMGARRWLDLGIVKFQPSEFLKVIMPIAVAAFITKRSIPIRFSYVILAFLVVLIPTGLIVIQPDLGTAVLVAFSGSVVIFLAGMSKLLICLIGGIAGCYIPIHWKFFMHDYQRQRILTFMDPESDPLGSGYHIIQSKIAIGSGGLFGKGWLNGTQTQLEFLPERHTDFAYAVFAEEFGLVGFVLLMVMYLYVLFRSAYISSHASTTFGKLLGGAITVTFFIYIFINIGMVSGLLPVVGVPLPLISFGGTSMVSICAGFGILMSIQTHKEEKLF